MPTTDSPESIIQSPTLSRRRWIKLAVDEELFEQLHVAAARSRMRITPYLRWHLAQARAIEANMGAADQPGDLTSRSSAPAC